MWVVEIDVFFWCGPQIAWFWREHRNWLRFCVVVRNYLDFSVGVDPLQTKKRGPGFKSHRGRTSVFSEMHLRTTAISLSKTHQRIGRIHSYITSKWLSRANTQPHTHRIRVINYLTVAIGAIVNHTNAPYTIVDCNKVSYSIVRYIRFRTASLPIKKSFLLRRWIRVHADVHGKDKYTSNWHLAHR